VPGGYDDEDAERDEKEERANQVDDGFAARRPFAVEDVHAHVGVVPQRVGRAQQEKEQVYFIRNQTNVVSPLISPAHP